MDNENENDANMKLNRSQPFYGVVMRKLTGQFSIQNLLKLQAALLALMLGAVTRENK
jgi:hypothetical protein